MSEPKNRLTDHEFAAIGRIANASAHLESTLDSAIQFVSQTPDATTLMGNAMLDAKMTIFLKLLERPLDRHRKELREFKELISTMRDHNSQRSTAVHGLWLTLAYVEKDATIIETPAYAVKRTARIEIAAAKELSEKINASRLRLKAQVVAIRPVIEAHVKPLPKHFWDSLLL